MVQLVQCMVQLAQLAQLGQLAQLQLAQLGQWAAQTESGPQTKIGARVSLRENRAWSHG